MHTDLNRKDQDSLANRMAEMRREAKERETEKEVEGFRESLHQAKTNSWANANSISMSKKHPKHPWHTRKANPFSTGIL